MKTEKDDRKVEKSYLIENWLTLNKTPFSQWKTETQHKNLLLMCLEIFEEMETELRKEKIPVKMDFREIAEDKEILCTCQVQAAVCALFYVLVCEYCGDCRSGRWPAGERTDTGCLRMSEAGGGLSGLYRV